MAVLNGALVLVKVGNGAPTEIFQTIGGLRVASLVFNKRALDASNLETGQWRALSSQGTQTLSIKGSGIYTDSASETLLRGYAFNGTAHNYRFIFASGSYIEGAFIITQYERSGDYDGEEMYALSLENAGNVAYYAA